jgi:SAM-dependent methyltransferase
MNAQSSQTKALNSSRAIEPRWLPLDVCRETLKNAGMGISFVRAWRMKRPRTGVFFTGRDEELEWYSFQALRSLLGVLGSVRGLDILEIGPGDFLSSGLSLLAAGASSYTVIDRFPGPYRSPEGKKWYLGIQRAWPRIFPQFAWPDYLRAEEFPEANEDRVRVLAGAVETAQSPQKYDVVCSYQVGEHVTDVNEFAKANARLLKPGGVAVHRVDFGPHDCWLHYADPLTFLRFPDWLWALMGSNRGTANRRRHHEFCSAFEAAGLQVEIAGREFFPEEQIDSSRFAKRFHGVPPESIATKTAVYVCRLQHTGAAAQQDIRKTE